jgi:hypothetical protein
MTLQSSILKQQEEPKDSSDSEEFELDLKSSPLKPEDSFGIYS